MRMLFEIDKKDYTPGGTMRVRPSARAIIIDHDKIGMIYSKQFNYYKFPGGGIVDGEDNIAALVREVLEETGHSVIEESIQEYGQVRRIHKGEDVDIFMQDNYYFFCQINNHDEQQNLDAYEADEGFTFQFVEPQVVVCTNEETIPKLSAFRQAMLERESRVTEMLMNEGYFNCQNDND